MYPANISVVPAYGTMMLPCEYPQGDNAPGSVQAEVGMCISHGELENSSLFPLTEFLNEPEDLSRCPQQCNLKGICY